MPISREMRLLEQRWKTGAGWPKRLDWIEIGGFRGWHGERLTFGFPIMAIVGENGCGKSTVLQCAASVYGHPDGVKSKANWYPTDFFPDTPWERITNAKVGYCAREGDQEVREDLRKPNERWRGYHSRPERFIENIDLSRTQPISGRSGFLKLAKPDHLEMRAEPFEESRLSRLSQIMGRGYERARMSTLDIDHRLSVPVLGHQGTQYSGFHQGAGETTVMELLKADMPKTSLVLIDEIETSLHPRAQRRLMRELATVCRERDVQVILTTHSPYILDELPTSARICIMITPDGKRSVMYGVSPEFAMSKMDDVPQYECDIYVEDIRAQVFLTEILTRTERDLVRRCRIIPCGPASVGKALGEMVDHRRWHRPVCVFLDGDQGAAPGCSRLPGEEAPERVVFEGLRAKGWPGIAERLDREVSVAIDHCQRAMTIEDEHEWVTVAANGLILGGDTLWQGLCGLWTKSCLDPAEGARIADAINSALMFDRPASPPPLPPTISAVPAYVLPPRPRLPVRKTASSSEPMLPFGQSLDVDPPTDSEP